MRFQVSQRRSSLESSTTLPTGSIPRCVLTAQISHLPAVCMVNRDHRIPDPSPLDVGVSERYLSSSQQRRQRRSENATGSKMARSPGIGTRPEMVKGDDGGAKWHGSLDADIIIANAPDPVFVSDLEGKILQANDAVSQLLGFRPDELIEQSLSRFISPEATREFTAALREVVERGVMRNVVLHPRSASEEVIPTTLNASALRDATGRVIGAIGILRDMRAYEKVVRDLEESKAELQDKILDLEKFEEVVVGRELKMIALEKEVEKLQHEIKQLRAESVR